MADRRGNGVAVRASSPPRRQASERRADIIAAAIEVFAGRGYAAPTASIARRAGISEAYLYRLFGTKRQLLLACYEAVGARVGRVLDEAAHGDGPAADCLPRMARAYGALLTAEERRLLLHVEASSTDPVIRGACRSRLHATLEQIAELSAKGPGAARAFYGELLLMNLADVLELPRSQLTPGDVDVCTVSV